MMKSFVLAALFALTSAKHHHHHPYHYAQMQADNSHTAEDDAPADAAAEVADVKDPVTLANESTAAAALSIAFKNAADAGKTKKELKAEAADATAKSQYELDLKIAELNMKEEKAEAE